MTNAQYQASQQLLKKHGGNYVDTRVSQIPANRALSQKVMGASGNAELSKIESSYDGQGKSNQLMNSALEN